MKRYKLDRHWFFNFGFPNPFEKKTERIVVDLPHDFSIIQKRDPNALGAPVTVFPDDMATYKKTLLIPEEWRDKKIILEFKGDRV